MKKSIFLTIGLVVALSAWFLSGSLRSSADTQPVALARDTVEAPTRVRVWTTQAQSVTREIVLNGATAPARTVNVRAETTGRVTQVGTARGTRVQHGDRLVLLAMDDRTARLDQARALVRQRKLEYQSTRMLGQKGYVAAIEVEKAYAAFEAARADLKRIEVDATHTAIRAPFDGILHERPVEVGDYVSPGTLIATLVDTATLTVTGHVPQQHIGALAIGGRGLARLVTGQEVEGRIRYLGATADADTRTFTVELTIPNPDGNLVAGVSSEIRLPVETVSAHFVSPALLALHGDDVLGVKAVGDDNTVVFYPARMVRASAQGVWLAGLPDTVRLITVGQGFVRPGEPVRPVPDETHPIRSHPSVPLPQQGT